MNRSALIALSVAAMAGMPAPQRKRKVLVVDDPPREPNRVPAAPAEALAPAPRETTDQRLARIRRELYASEGKRQGERIAKGKYDFGASERCIARIKAKNRGE
jgi:hypothetical protein